MFRFFETRIDFRKKPPEEAPPDTLWGFYWHFIRQAKGLFLALFALGFVLAVVEALVPWLIGRLVNALSTATPKGIFDEAGPLLIAMAAIILLVRPLGTILFRLLVNHSLAVSFTTMVHWQNYWHVVRQPLNFFQEDFAGRIANRVLQTGRPLRETVLSVARAVWQILIFGAASIGLMGTQDWRLALPMAGWFVLYAALLGFSVPRIQKLSRLSSEARSAVTGKVVDSFTNIMTVKLFGRRKDEDEYISEGYSRLNDAFMRQQRVNTLYVAGLTFLNAVFLVATGAVAVWLFSENRVDAGTMTTALLLSTQIVSMSGWVAFEVMGIFENVGTVQEGMKTISRPLTMQDKPTARPLSVLRGEIRFEDVSFSYGEGDRVIDRLNLTIRPGEKIGLVGRSGVGKTTLVNLLLRFFLPQEGRILIDGQDIADVQEESLREKISVVTQDTSLLHRSIRENILYGRPDASEEAMREAARQAHATEFIERLVDGRGRRGFDAHVGERGVKLSGGQRQRIAIARVILKDAPILVLDEATSALDSEVEAAIQESLATLMEGKTVIAIAHRLSTLQLMDRLIVMDEARIVEEGTHRELLENNGLYAGLWSRQSGGFLAPRGETRDEAV
ncbi:ABC transporter ATP-binding protein [Microvirga arsenatis]|uniref:ATP-binding cassette domain-containing protein n=1 Tax=Microvirga arsenatis TaxID=2692265 RepID=A0ABW9YUE7_9HYPH|nr:ABC transporter ATP-binding protein [Microvirga arsenatis]NBJ09392.1 ATP-binding cassette domain-containing protein [Microvirga arsenatis]NBJ23750.1 ATP-binding cassette domain-containing protein [Microvirga arsenatis]